MDNEEIIQELEKLDKESQSIKNELIRITWWMRGGVTYEQAYQLGFKERQMINSLIKDNIETSKKTGVPIF
jgi:hypothetical protein